MEDLIRLNKMKVRDHVNYLHC